MTPCQADLALRREVAATTGQPMTPTPFDMLDRLASGGTAYNAAAREVRAMLKTSGSGDDTP